MDLWEGERQDGRQKKEARRRTERIEERKINKVRETE
jgi:hypothetical protein